MSLEKFDAQNHRFYQNHTKKTSIDRRYHLINGNQVEKKENNITEQLFVRPFFLHGSWSSTISDNYNQHCLRKYSSNEMLSNIDEVFVMNFKNDFASSSSSTIVASELLTSYSTIDSLSPELDALSNLSSSLEPDVSSVQSSIPTHFDMSNPNEWVLAYSLIKQSAVQLERPSDEEILRLTTGQSNQTCSNHLSTNFTTEDLPRVRGPKSTRFTCPICGLITVSMERLQRHVNQHGQKLSLETYKPEKKVSSLACEKCKATFSSAYALRKHQRVHTRGSLLFIVRENDRFTRKSRTFVFLFYRQTIFV